MQCLAVIFKISVFTTTLDIKVSTVPFHFSYQFSEEGQILQGFEHPSIIGLKGVVTKNRPMMIFTEYMENGSLDEYLKKVRGEITGKKS